MPMMSGRDRMRKAQLMRPDIERLKTAIRGGTADRVPNFEICIEARNVESILGRRVGSTMAASRGVSPGGSCSEPMDPLDYIEICRRVGQDAIGIEAGWVPFKSEDDAGNLHLVNDGRIKSLEDFEKVKKPSWELDYKPKFEQLKRYKSALQGTGIGLFFAPGCLFQGCYQFLIGFDDFFEKLYSERHFVEIVLDSCLEYYLRVTELALEVGIDLLWIGDDLAYKSGSFIDPEIYRSIWLPRMRKLVELGRQADIPIVFHSCGNVTNLIENVILELKIDCLNPIEPYCMNISDIKQRYGKRIAISGNIDIAGPLAMGTPDQVKEMVRAHVEKLKPGGGFVLSSSHSITDDIPPENFRAMIDAVIEYGEY